MIQMAGSSLTFFVTCICSFSSRPHFTPLSFISGYTGVCLLKPAHGLCLSWLFSPTGSSSKAPKLMSLQRLFKKYRHLRVSTFVWRKRLDASFDAICLPGLFSKWEKYQSRKISSSFRNILADDVMFLTVHNAVLWSAVLHVWILSLLTRIETYQCFGVHFITKASIHELNWCMGSACKSVVDY